MSGRDWPAAPAPTGYFDTGDPDKSQLRELARANAFALRDTAGWLHRRVERITYTERRMVRRQFSVNFSIPLAKDGGSAFRAYKRLPDRRFVYYVPVAALQK